MTMEYSSEFRVDLFGCQQKKGHRKICLSMMTSNRQKICVLNKKKNLDCIELLETKSFELFSSRE